MTESDELKLEHFKKLAYDTVHNWAAEVGYVEMNAELERLISEIVKALITVSTME